MDSPHVCRACGQPVRTSFNFCPSCGIPLAQGRNPTTPIQPPRPAYGGSSREGAPSAERTEYLSRRGLLHKAQESYTLRLSVPGRLMPVRIKLLGWQTRGDAINALRSTGLLDDSTEYEIPEWPRVTPDWPGPGSLFLRVPACVCELESKTYQVRKPQEDFRPPPLYGCPNAKELEGIVLDRRAEVVDCA